MLKDKSGSSILEAMIASLIISITAIAFGNFQVNNFSRILENERVSKISYSASDFSSKMLINISNRETEAKKTQVKNIYKNIDFNVTYNQCINNTPSYVTDCLNTDLTNLTICDLDKSILFDVFNFSCSVLETSKNGKIDIDDCIDKTDSICLMVNYDGTVRNENSCRDNPQACILMEVKY